MIAPIIKATNLTKTFSTEAGELEVLKGIDLTIERGEVVSIVGASGAGKSTLLHVLGTIDRPSSGTVHYKNQEVSLFNDRTLAAFRNRMIGFVFQFHHLLPEFNTIENTIMPGLIMGMDRMVLNDRAESLLQELGLTKRFHHRPGELSGGEQQRVAVARALILDPIVVLADEPTGNLDTKTGQELFHLMLSLNREKGTTFVIVTHNDSLTKQCERVYEMVDGRLKE